MSVSLGAIGRFRRKTSHASIASAWERRDSDQAGGYERVLARHRDLVVAGSAALSRGGLGWHADAVGVWAAANPLASPSHSPSLAGWLGIAFFVLLLTAVILGSVAERRQARERRDALARFAARHGLRYLGRPQRDQRDLLGHDFPLLHQGIGQGCVNVVSGRWGGLAIQGADYSYFVGGPGHVARYGPISIAVADLGQTLPAVLVSPPSLLRSIRANRPGQPDVDVGSAGFSTMFRVQADAPAAARELLGPGMTEWLVSTGGTFAFEVRGDHLLVWCRLLDATRLASILDAATGFAAHLPTRA